MYNQGYRPQPGQTKSGYYDAQGNWYVPAPGQAGPGQPQRRRASQPALRQRRASQPPKPPRDARRKGQATAQKAQPQVAAREGAAGYDPAGRRGRVRLYLEDSERRAPLSQRVSGQRERGRHRSVRFDLGGRQPAGLGPCEPETKRLVCAASQHQRTVQGHHRPDAGHLL